jgi:hypothetical protein
MKRLAVFIIILALTATTHAGVTPTPETLAAQFIAAVNDKSAEKQKAIIHPLCFANLSTIQKQFLDETLASEFRKPIPKTATTKVERLEAPTLPFAGMVEWPVKPTHQLEVHFSTGEYASTTMIRFIAQEKNQWFIIVPMLNAENLKNYEATKKSQQAESTVPVKSAPSASSTVR